MRKSPLLFSICMQLKQIFFYPYVDPDAYQPCFGLTGNRKTDHAYSWTQKKHYSFSSFMLGYPCVRMMATLFSSFLG